MANIKRQRQIKAGLKKLSDRGTVPFRGGSYTEIEKALIEQGRYSMVQNMRNRYPGLIQRKGASRKHTTKDYVVAPLPPDDWLGTWQKRLELTIDDTDVDSDLSNFPVLIQLSTSSGTGTDDVSAVFDELGSDANRTKIAVTTDDGETQCYVEIERWDDANEEAWLWVKVPEILATGGATLYLYYDSTQAANTAYVGDTESTPAKAVWDANYIAVYHMAQDPNGDAANAVKDSTGNVIHATPGGTMTTADLVAGAIGKAIDFDGSDDYLQTPDASDALDIVSTITLECAIIPTVTLDDGLANNVRMINRQSFPNEVDSYALFINANGLLQFATVGGNIQSTQDSWTQDVTYFLAGTYNVSGLTGKLFVDGVEETLSSDSFDEMAGGSNSLMIGAGEPGEVYPDWFPGTIDEVRISDIVRTDAWLKATYHSNDDDLVAFGSEEDFDEESIDTYEDPTKVLNLYQFSKGKVAEKHFFAQMSDGDLLEATDAPPTVTSGPFGPEVHDGAAGQEAAGFAHLNDIMLYSNGINQHQLYPGDGNYVDSFWTYDGTALEIIPTLGADFSLEVSDGDGATVAILDSLNTWANYACLYIHTPVPANKLTFTVTAPNGTTSVATLNYWKSDESWADASATDGTIDDTDKTFGKTGSFVWEHPTDEVSKLQFGKTGYWYQIIVDTQLDAEVEVSAVTYGGGFRPLQNVWNGLYDYLIEAIFEDDSESISFTYPSNSILIEGMTTSDKIYLSSYDKLIGFYIDVGATPNTETGADIAAGDVEYWNGTAWTSVGTPTDETDGMNKSGTVMWDRMSDDYAKYLSEAKYTAHWYRLSISATVTGDAIIAVSGIPYFEMANLGKGGTNCAWKDRACYTFNKYPQYIYVSAKDRINVLNGDDFAILEAGDGRANRITCMKKFHNELMVWQEEKGKEGGCLTIFEGYSPSTFGKLVLSTKVGTFNNKSAVVVDGVLTATKTDEVLRTLAFFISHYGICKTDGRTVTVISDDINNYFDPTSSDCIRRGYESEMWVEHDTAYNVLRFGLVTGTSATTCNTFPVYDLIDKTWSFDVHGQNLSCVTEVEANSGNIPILQYGGGTDDGSINQLNTGTDDVDIDNTTNAIDAFVRVEFGLQGLILALRQLVVRVKVQDAGDMTVTPYRNDTEGSDAMELEMTAENSGDKVRRHRIGLQLQGQQCSLKFQNAVASQELYLLDLGVEMYEKEGH